MSTTTTALDRGIQRGARRAMGCDGAPIWRAAWRNLSLSSRPGRGLLLLLLLLMTSPAAMAQAPSRDHGNDVMARVNGAVITRRQFQIAYRQAVDRHARQGQPVDEAHIAPLRRSVIQRLVEEELLWQESRRQGVAVTDRELEEAVAAERARLGGEEQFAAELARLHMDANQHRRLRRRQLAVERLLARRVAPDVVISEDEIRRYYEAHRQRFQVPEAVRVRHILIRRTVDGAKDGGASAQRRITRIRAQLEAGADFVALAERHSEEPAGAQGGDLGYIQRGQMLPPLDQAAFALAIGEISPVVTTAIGFHVLMVTDRRQATTKPLEAARADIRTTLRQAAYDRAVSAYIRTLRAKADIQAAW